MANSAEGVKFGPMFTVKASVKHTATVIFLHGLGDVGSSWAAVFEHMCRQPHIKYLCPTAPQRPVTINHGHVSPAWYDVGQLDADLDIDLIKGGLEESAEMVKGLFEAEIQAGIPSERIIVGGFSMGGSVALHTAFTYEKPLAGVLVLSSGLIGVETFREQYKINAAKVPILQGHGDCDTVWPMKFGEACANKVKEFNPNLTFNVYKGISHDVSQQELNDVKHFIKKYLPQAIF